MGQPQPDTPAPLCGSYSVVVTDKRTRQAIAKLPANATNGHWGRDSNTTSAASAAVDLAEAGRRCLDQLADVHCLGHELRVNRRRSNGKPDEVWVGPITSVIEDNGTLSITAQDRSLHWSRAIATDHVHGVDNPIDVSALFVELAKDADYYDPTGILLAPTPTGILATITVLRAQRWPIRYFLDQLAKTVIDWSLAGRLAWIGGQEIFPDVMGTLAPLHWLENQAPEVEEDGLAFASRVIVRGANGVVLAEWPEVGGPIVDPFFGHRDFEVNDRQLTDVNLARAKAQATWEKRHAMPTYVTAGPSSTLGPAAPVDVAGMVPGQRWNLSTLDLAGRTVQSTERLTALRVEFGPGDGEMVETSVRPSFEPPGAQVPFDPVKLIAVTPPISSPNNQATA